MATYYRIRRKSDGLHSVGGSIPKFNKLGKLWTKAHLSQHLRSLRNWSTRTNDPKNRYADCEIIECILDERYHCSVDEYMASLA